MKVKVFKKRIGDRNLRQRRYGKWGGEILE
jgi:hypothetical protein